MRREGHGNMTHFCHLYLRASVFTFPETFPTVKGRGPVSSSDALYSVLGAVLGLVLAPISWPPPRRTQSLPHFPIAPRPVPRGILKEVDTRGKRMDHISCCPVSGQFFLSRRPLPGEEEENKGSWQDKVLLCREEAGPCPRAACQLFP